MDCGFLINFLIQFYIEFENSQGVDPIFRKFAFGLFSISIIKIRFNFICSHKTFCHV